MKIKLFLCFLIVVGFFYRIYGLSANYSFWTDEEHVAIFARAILERGKPALADGYSTGVYQWLQYWLSAISAKFFGLNEFAIRLPSVTFGVLTIWAVYLLGKELFNKEVGLVTAIFTTFLKIEVLWSRQARPYQALQFFYLLGAYFIYRLAEKDKFNRRYLFGFLGSGVLASLMHGLGLAVFLNGFLYLLIFRFSWVKKKLLVLGILLALVFCFLFRFQLLSVFSRIGKINNPFYYRVFLWHNYSLLVFLALIGFLFLFLQGKKGWQILVLFLMIQGIIVSFFLGQPFVRYFYIVFPFLILLSAVGLVEISRLTARNSQLLILTILVLFIIGMGYKFTLLPQRDYSLNEDMQEIPEVDWKKVYRFVGERLEKSGDVTLVTNWTDLPVWFLGEGRLNYLVRKRKNSIIRIDSFTNAAVIPSLNEFKEIVREKKKGLIVIDSWDDYIPDGVREYCRENFKKELEVDRLYPIQPRYWPVEVYSWGI